MRNWSRRVRRISTLRYTYFVFKIGAEDKRMVEYRKVQSIIEGFMCIDRTYVYNF